MSRILRRLVGVSVLGVLCLMVVGLTPGQFIIRIPPTVQGGGAHFPNGTVNASSCSPADVQTAITTAVDGQIVHIPNGNCSWTSGVTVSGKGIYLKGETEGSVNLTHNASGTTMITLATDASHHVAVGNLDFLRGSGTGEYLDVSGSSAKVALIHDCYFDVPDNFGVLRNIEWQALGGVLWNLTFESLTPGGGNGPGSGSGNLKITSPKAWLDASTWGTQDTNGLLNLYIEDSTFLHIYNQAVDCDDNCRLVVRYTLIRNTQFLHHGTTSLQGGRQSELYNNTFDYAVAAFGDTYTDVNLNRYMWLRAGTFRVSNNAIDPISSGTWGGAKDEFVFMAESLTRSGAGAACQVEADYPGTHWSGHGSNGSAQVSDPIRFWSNTGTWNWTTNDHTGFDCSGGSSANVILIDRDVFLSAPGGYTTYTYPHPLRSGM